MRPEEIVDRYLAAVSDLTTSRETLAELLHDEYVFKEHPNAINPNGSERDRETSLASFGRAAEILESHAFTVLEHLVCGGVVVSRMTWEGRMKNGTELRAHISQHNTLRDGRIWRTESYDCYEPFGG